MSSFSLQFSVEQFQHGITCDFLSLSTLLIYKKSINDQSETFKAHSDLGLQCGTFKCNNYATSENYAARL